MTKFRWQLLRLKETYGLLLWKKHILSDFINTYFFKSKLTALTPFGFKLVTGTYRDNRLMLKGAYESDKLDIIKNYLSTADVFVDVGANVGYYTCLALSLGKYVVAVEPQPQNLECLYANLSSNGWTDAEVFPLGLSSKPGVLTLYGASGLCASLVKGWAGYSGRFKQIIPVNTMDSILSNRFNEKKLLIKIDVEGAEFGVLQGAEKTIAMFPRPTWFIEVSPRLFHPDSSNPHYEAIFDLFWQHDYEVHLANKESHLVTPADVKEWQVANISPTDEYNYLFIPRK